MNQTSDNSNLTATPTEVTEVSDANFESEVLQSKLPVIVAFCAPWSRPCQVFLGALEEVAAERAGQLKVVMLNADNNPDFSLAYDVQYIPTLLYFTDGRLRDRIVGTATKQAILSKLEAGRPNRTVATATSRPAVPPGYSARRQQHHVTFFCEAPHAAQVDLVGDFNKWQPAAHPMQRMPDGWWKTDLELPHGYHHYLFLVDGKPVLDPKAMGKARNAQGEPVSLVAVS